MSWARSWSPHACAAGESAAAAAAAAPQGPSRPPCAWATRRASAFQPTSAAAYCSCPRSAASWGCSSWGSPAPGAAPAPRAYHRCCRGLRTVVAAAGGGDDAGESGARGCWRASVDCGRRENGRIEGRREALSAVN